MSNAAPQPDKTISIFHFNDVYNIEPSPNEPKGGAARLVTAYQSIQDRNPMVLFSGDCLNPSSISGLEKGDQMIPVLNGVNVTCAVLGNHEFDFGLDVLEKFMSKCKFPWLLSNVLDKQTGKPLAGAKETYIKDWNGVTVGFLGLAEEEWLGTLPQLELSDMTYIDYVESANTLTKELRQQGADIVVALTHMTLINDEKLLEKVDDVDIVFGGHDHHYVVKQVNGRYVVKSGSDFHTASVVTLHVREDNSLAPVTDSDVEKLVLDSSIAENVQMKGKVDSYLEKLERTNKVLGNCNVDLDGQFEHIRAKETNLGNLVADIMVRATGADVAIINSGTFRSDCIHPPGPFTNNDLFRILPLQDRLCVLYATGVELHEALENGVSLYPQLAGRFPQVSGIKFQLNPQSTPGQRVDKETIRVKGLPLQNDKVYKVCVKDYIANGKDGYEVLKCCAKAMPTGPLLTDLVKDFFEIGQSNSLNRYSSEDEVDTCNNPTHHHTHNNAHFPPIPSVEGRIVILNSSTSKHLHSDYNGNLSQTLMADE